MAAKAARASAQLAQTTGGRLYPIIYADPPWRFEPYPRETGMSRAADNHYPTLSTDAIAAITVPAAEDCILFLWATVAMLPQALHVMVVWGFTYKSAYLWHKPGRGHGYWSCEEQVEELLVGTRGRVPAPVMGTQPLQLQTYPRGTHSAKPVEFRTMIQQLYPTCAETQRAHAVRRRRAGMHGAVLRDRADRAGRYRLGRAERSNCCRTLSAAAA